MIACIPRCLTFAAILFGTIPVRAESEAPELETIFPVGCQRGSSIEISLNGKNLEQASALVFAHPGIRSERIGENRLRVIVSEEVVAGDWDAWVLTPIGLSNPRRFAVTDSPVFTESEENDTLPYSSEDSNTWSRRCEVRSSGPISIGSALMALQVNRLQFHAVR